MSRDIFLNIDTIVLRGMDHVDRHELATALQQAMVEQLASNPQLIAADLERVKTHISLPGTFATEQLGQALAGSLSGIISNCEPGPDTDHKLSAGERRHA